MSRIDDLIKEHCPNGVEYKALGEVVVNRDSERRPITRTMRSAGHFPYYGANGVQDWVDSYIFDGTFLLVGEDGSVFRGDGSPVLNWASGQIWVNNHAHVLEAKTDAVNLRFLYFYLQTIDVRPYATGGTQPKLNQRNMNLIRVPVPPLVLQREIVEILDKMEALEAELQAELQARASQYAYYRDALLSFSDEISQTPLSQSTTVRWTTLGELLDLRAGQFISASEISKQPAADRPVPCFGGGELRGYVDKPSHTGPLAIIGRQGARCGQVTRVFGSFYATEHAVVATPRDGVDVSWSFHLLSSLNINQYASRSAQPGLAVGTIAKVQVPVPDFDLQVRAGMILDKFDALVNDLSSGLPAEIAARRKQYEYYRDRLLTFEEAA